MLPTTIRAGKAIGRDQDIAFENCPYTLLTVPATLKLQNGFGRSRALGLVDKSSPRCPKPRPQGTLVSRKWPVPVPLTGVRKSSARSRGRGFTPHENHQAGNSFLPCSAIAPVPAHNRPEGNALATI